jgi:hypothetical protein
LIHITCFRCRRRFDLDPVWVGIQLRKLKTKHPKFYQTDCPACQAINKVSVGEMQKELEAVADQIEAGLSAQP